MSNLDLSPFTKMDSMAITTALTILRRAGFKYHIVGAGIELGSPVVSQKPPQKRTRIGSTKYVLGFMADLEPGDSVYIPRAHFRREQVGSAASSNAFALWGKDGYKTMTDQDGVHVRRNPLEIEPGLEACTHE